MDVINIKFTHCIICVMLLLYENSCPPLFIPSLDQKKTFCASQLTISFTQIQLDMLKKLHGPINIVQLDQFTMINKVNLKRNVKSLEIKYITVIATSL